MKDSFTKFWTQIQRDKWLILFCILLSFFGWQGIRKNIGFEVSVSNIAVDVDLPDGWAVWEKSVNRVNILFRGSRESVRYLNNEQLKVIIPVPDPVRGDEMTIKLSEQNLRNPTGAKVVRFSPSEIVIRLDQETERLLPVKAAVNGSLPEGLDIDRIVCSPATVRISGARQVLEGMENIHTEPVDLKDRQDTFKESVPIALPQVGRMSVDPDWVSVEIFLETRDRTETFEEIPVQVLSAPGEQRQINLEPQMVTVVIKGQEQQIEDLRKNQIFAYVNCLNLIESASYDLPVIIDLPSGIQMVKAEPGVVRVEVQNPK